MHFMQGGSPYSGLSVPSQSVGFPGLVGFDDLELSASGVSLGLDSSGRNVSVDLDSESPHILVNASTGAGKSTVARSMAVQRLVQGDVVVVLDRKMHSHRWARPLAPLVHYADQVQSIGSSLFNLGRELHRRNLVARDWAGSVESAPVGPRVVVLFEELNATLTQLRELDKQVKSAYTSLDAFRDLVFMGRAVRMHVVGFAQLASYRSGLSQDILENFGTKVMIQYSDKAWSYLARDCGRYRPAPSEVGRGIVCHRGRAVESQLGWIDEDSAREAVLEALPAQRQARALAGSVRNLSPVWRQAIGR